MKVLEKDVENTILHFLRRQPNVFAMKLNNVGVWDQSRKIYRKPNSPYILKGVPDIMGVVSPCGRALALEVKSPQAYRPIMKNYDEIKNTFPGLLSKSKLHVQEQILFLEEIKRMGGIAGFVCSVETTIDILKAEGIKLRGDYPWTK